MYVSMSCQDPGMSSLMGQGNTSEEYDTQTTAATKTGTTTMTTTTLPECLKIGRRSVKMTLGDLSRATLPWPADIKISKCK